MPVLDLNKRRAERPRVEPLELKIGEKVFYIPLGQDMKYYELAELQDSEKQREFFARYIDAETMEALTVADITDIMSAWSEATTKGTGASLGESSASHDS